MRWCHNGGLNDNAYNELSLQVTTLLWGCSRGFIPRPGETTASWLRLLTSKTNQARGGDLRLRKQTKHPSLISRYPSYSVPFWEEQGDGCADYTLQQEQWVPRSIDEVFAFFADAHNLEEITPSWLGFKILSMSDASIKEGTEIRYRLRLHGIPIHWQTDICRWDPPHCFVDVQRTGPYKTWHHTHRFEAHGDRTRMVDVVRYSLPFGILGRILHTWKIRADIQKIFDYRRQRIEEMFREQKDSAT